MLLKKGSSGQQVVELQEGLEALGYELGMCDGAFGPATEKAVKAFQTAENLKVDGLVGKGTIGAMNKLLEAKGLDQVGDEFQEEEEEFVASLINSQEETALHQQHFVQMPLKLIKLFMRKFNSLVVILPLLVAKEVFPPGQDQPAQRLQCIMLV
jgi:hypothetical protein